MSLGVSSLAKASVATAEAKEGATEGCLLGEVTVSFQRVLGRKVKGERIILRSYNETEACGAMSSTV